MLQSIPGAAVLAATMLLAAGPAPAAPQHSDLSSNRRSVPIEFARSDLTSGAGAERIYWRIEHAARSACGEPTYFVRDLKMEQRIQQCEKDAVADAVGRIDTPMLTTMYDLYAPQNPLEPGPRLRTASASDAAHGSGHL
jgi:UrcA family protein